MKARQILLTALLGAIGLIAAGAIAMAATEITGDEIGLSTRPVSVRGVDNGARPKPAPAAKRAEREDHGGLVDNGGSDNSGPGSGTGIGSGEDSPSSGSGGHDGGSEPGNESGGDSGHGSDSSGSGSGSDPEPDGN